MVDSLSLSTIVDIVYTLGRGKGCKGCHAERSEASFFKRLAIKNQLALRADEIIPFQTRVVQQPLAEKRIADGFACDKNAKRCPICSSSKQAETSSSTIADMAHSFRGGMENANANLLLMNIIGRSQCVIITEFSRDWTQ